MSARERLLKAAEANGWTRNEDYPAWGEQFCKASLMISLSFTKVGGVHDTGAALSVHPICQRRTVTVPHGPNRVKQIIAWMEGTA
jgi:hypothetical protein